MNSTLAHSEIPAGVYPTLADFETDDEPLNEMAQFAAAASGMKDNWKTHKKTLGEIVAAMKPYARRSGQLATELNDPAFAHFHRKAMQDAWSVILGIEIIDRDNPTLKITERIMGVWALRMIAIIHKYPLYSFNLKDIISDSKPYKKIKASKPKSAIKN